jgi:glycosyltransferase involved in cell wall biosynthesis
MKKLTIIIEASNIKAGGGTTHLVEILKLWDPEIQNGINEVIVISSKSTLDQLPDKIYIKKISSFFLNQSLFLRTFWQIFLSSRFTRLLNGDILLSVGGLYLGDYQPFVSMSRNMLFFDKNESKRYGLSLFRLKFPIMHFLQLLSFKKSSGVIFISNYAKNSIYDNFLSGNKKYAIINHGVAQRFKNQPKPQLPISQYSIQYPFRILYISSIDVYKHQWQLIEVIGRLRRAGYPIVLDLVGSALHQSSYRKVEKAIEYNDYFNEFITFSGAISYDEIQKKYVEANMFVYCSTCENMPNILIEAMSAGLPIASSHYAPMPEFLNDGAVFFDPINQESIFFSIKNLLNNHIKRNEIANKAYKYAEEYTWERCANETFNFLNSVCVSHVHI